MSNQKQQITDLFFSVDKPQKHMLSERRQMQKTTYYIFPFIRNVQKCTRKQSRLPEADSRKEDSLGMSLKALWIDGNVLTLDCSDGCTTFYIYQRSLNCMLKMGKFYGM